MLLSEVLNIAKKIGEKNPLNESVKSVTLSKLFKKFEYSNITVKPISTRYSYRSSDDDNGRNFFDLVYAYEELAETGRLTSKLCDTIEGRLHILSCKYEPRKKTVYYNELIENNGIINDLINAISFKTGKKMGISDINDSDLVEISPELSKKKQYKSCLLFWIDYDDELRAVTMDNTVIAYIQKSSKYGSWYTVNPDYDEKTDYSKFATSTQIVEDYIFKAFKEIPVYKIAIKSKDIKEALGADNIKNLQKVSGIVRIYAVTNTSIDVTEKVNSRREYKLFLKNYLNMAISNVKRYRDQIKINRNRGVESIVIDNVNRFILTLLDCMSEVNDELFNFIDKPYSGKLYYYSMSIPSIYTSFTKLMFGEDTRKFYKSTTKGSSLYYFNIESAYDYFSIICIYMKICLSYAQDVLAAYKNYNNAVAANNEHDMVEWLSSIKLRYGYLKNCADANGLNTEPAKKSVDRLYDEFNVNINNILNKITLFPFAKIQK